jgi:hypothetical protein
MCEDSLQRRQDFVSASALLGSTVNVLYQNDYTPDRITHCLEIFLHQIALKHNNTERPHNESKVMSATEDVIITHYQSKTRVAQMENISRDGSAAMLHFF